MSNSIAYAAPKGHRMFAPIAMLYVTMLLISDTVAVKLVTFLGFVLPSGILCFPLVYLLNDVLTEIYGFERTRSVIWWGFFCLALMTLVYGLSVWMPYPPFWRDQAAFEKLFGLVPRIAFASFVAYLIGSFLNSIVLSKMKIWTNGKHLWTRTIGSTVVGEGADSIVFNVVAFAGVFALSDVMYIAFSGFVLKTLYEVLATPLTYVVVGKLKRIEEEDKFDVGVSYSPLPIR